MLDRLKPIMESYAKEGKLDEALAIREVMQKFRKDAVKVLPDPGTLLDYQHEINQSFLFEVTGADQGNLWGTGVYTADSELAVAAVHAGILQIGEKGLVRVQMLSMQGMTISGSVKNNVRSSAWGPYPVGYRPSPAGF